MPPSHATRGNLFTHPPYFIKSPAEELPGRGYRLKRAYDLFRSEDNRPRANPRPARDRPKRASVEPASGTEKGLSVVGSEFRR